MSQAACKQAMCSGWPMPAQADIPAGATAKIIAFTFAKEERAVRRVLISSAYLGQAEAYGSDPLWVAMIAAIGHTPMTDAQIKTAQKYIHLLGDG